MNGYVSPPPSDAPISLDRRVAELMSLIDLNAGSYRLLWYLLGHQHPDTGTVRVSQREASAALGVVLPTINRAFKELAAVGLIVTYQPGEYQLHPLLTNGKTAGPVTSIPPIAALDPESFNAQRRQRYERQICNLRSSA